MGHPGGVDVLLDEDEEGGLDAALAGDGALPRGAVAEGDAGELDPGDAVNAGGPEGLLNERVGGGAGEVEGLGEFGGAVGDRERLRHDRSGVPVNDDVGRSDGTTRGDDGSLRSGCRFIRCAEVQHETLAGGDGLPVDFANDAAGATVGSEVD